ELRRLLVKIAVEQSDFKLARDHLQRLLRWQDVESWIARDTTALKNNRPLPELMEEKDRGELECWWGQVLESEKKADDAIGCYRLAVRHAPRLRTSFVQLAYLLRRQPVTDPILRKDIDRDADKFIDQLVETNPTSHEPYLERWHYRREFKLLKISETGNQGK